LGNAEAELEFRAPTIVSVGNLRLSVGKIPARPYNDADSASEHEEAHLTILHHASAAAAAADLKAIRSPGTICIN